jgi:hypothetical protein
MAASCALFRPRYLPHVVMTWWDMARRDRVDSWRRIRGLRSHPPARVNARRRATYAAALEQAEQQFDAAAQVATQSRAINLFYGMSQAGRAIACAYADAGEPYELRGHGITNKNLDEVPAERLPSLTVQAQGGSNSSFRRLSELIGSASLAEPVEIGALWAMLVEPTIRGERLTPDAVPSLMVTAPATNPTDLASLRFRLNSSPTDLTKTRWPSCTPLSGRQRVGRNVADLRLEAFK